MISNLLCSKKYDINSQIIVRIDLSESINVLMLFITWQP